MSSVEQSSAPAGVDPNSDEGKRLAQVARSSRLRQEQALQLQRENILSQRTSNPGRRAALEAALQQIEAQLAELS